MTAFAAAIPPGPGTNGNGTNVNGYDLDSVVFWHCHASNLYGSRYAGYDDGVTNLLVYGCTFFNIDAVCQPKDGSGMEHCWYSNDSQPRPAHPNVRFINDILATPESMGWKDCAGGLCDSCLFVGCPIDGMFDHYATTIHNMVSDGEDADLDPLQSADCNSVSQTATPGLTMSDGTVGTPGKDNGYERGYGFMTVTQPTFTIDGALFIDKTSPVDLYPWLNISTSQQNSGDPNVISDPPVAGTFVLNNVIVHDFWQSPWDSVDAGPDSYSVNSSGTAAPSIVCTNCILPGVTGIAGVTSTEPTYANSGMTVSTYAKSLGISGVTDTMTFLQAAANNAPATFDPRLTGAAAVAAIRGGFAPAQ
jgi:hypothetical protein